MSVVDERDVQRRGLAVAVQARARLHRVAHHVDHDVAVVVPGNRVEVDLVAVCLVAGDNWLS